MFEEICLNCGKHLKHDGAYCSEDCQNSDATSPSISSAASAASSASPSPHLGYAVGGEVPALVPSALGYALRHHHGHRHSVSSSSASSTSWSIATDEDEDDPSFRVGGESDPMDPLYDSHSKSPSFLLHNFLSYTRRPSGTNNRSTVAHLHRRTSSGSFTGHVRSALTSAESTEEEDYPSDSGLEEDPRSHHFFQAGQSAPDRRTMAAYDNKADRASTITMAKRARNRASLPTYFSLLQQMPSSSDSSSSPSSSQTAALAGRPSPSTPRLSLAGLSARPSLTAPPTASIYATPRGRRRDFGRLIEPAESPSDSNSRTRERQTTLTDKLPPGPLLSRSRVSSKGSVEQVFDWSSAPQVSPVRGRAAVRRNSSPPPKVMQSLMGLQFAYESSVSPHQTECAASSDTKNRGRARVEDLDGIGCPVDAPGYGHGRSGLLDREKRRGVVKQFRS